MKFINKILIVVFLLGSINGCDNLDFDLQQDPNQITPEQASLNDPPPLRHRPRLPRGHQDCG